MAEKNLTHDDAKLVLKLYDLRREAVMRESRSAINGKFWPKSFADVKELMTPDHPLNAAFRQTSSYWEMVYGFSRNGIINADFLCESNAEGLFLFAKIFPWLEDVRANSSPLAFRNAEWITQNSQEAKRRFDLFRKRVETMASR